MSTERNEEDIRVSCPYCNAQVNFSNWCPHLVYIWDENEQHMMNVGGDQSIVDEALPPLPDDDDVVRAPLDIKKFCKQHGLQARLLDFEVPIAMLGKCHFIFGATRAS